MKSRRDALFLLAGGGAADLAFRIAQVALPLVVLQETGSVAATGLAGGAAGIPVVLSPWWARKARQWVDSGSRLAVVAAVQAVALAMVPMAAALGWLHAGVLIASGLLLGCGDALSNPGRSALLADTGDRWDLEAGARREPGGGKATPAGGGRRGEEREGGGRRGEEREGGRRRGEEREGGGRRAERRDHAVVLLTWQDGIRRVGMVVGPPIGALAVAAAWTNALLWVEAAAVLAAGMLAVGIIGERSTTTTETPSIRGSLVGRKDVLYGWIARGTGCLTWFSFTLGLSVIGAERGQPGVYLAAGMSGYGVGSVVGTMASLAVIRRVSPVPLAAISWTLMGLCWIGMGVWTTPAAIAVLGALSGVTVVMGIGAISMLITRSSAGAERRALLSGQSVVVNASSSAGLLIGGPVIAAAGAEYTLIGAGALTSVVALGVLLQRNRAARESPPCDTAGHVRSRDHDARRAA
ncbi:MFS transporter [Kribbella sancticallisti]|uniref:MFS transporter n=1 Tax=Kribbella sancticallisti TaxID=460087 RepID=UPI0031D996DB